MRPLRLLAATAVAAALILPAAPALPAAIPRDPLTGTAEVGTPLATRTLLLACLAPFTVTLLMWLALALRRARATDPLRPQREAQLRLTQHLTTLDRAAGDAPRRAQLLAWQHDTAVLWSIPHAAPAASTLTDATWRTLWQEADRAIYSAQFTLPGDWSARAQAALAAQQLPVLA